MYLKTIHSTALPLGTVNARLLLGCGFGPTVLLHPAETVCSSGSEKTQCSVAYSNKMCVRTLQGFRVMIICPNLRSELRYSRAGCLASPASYRLHTCLLTPHCIILSLLLAPFQSPAVTCSQFWTLFTLEAPPFTVKRQR